LEDQGGTVFDLKTLDQFYDLELVKGLYCFSKNQMKIEMLVIDRQKTLEDLICECRLLIPDETEIDLARWVSTLTTNAGTMLPKTAQEVLDMFAQGRSVIILDGDGVPMAHSAVTFIYEEQKFVELGGVIVDPDSRKKGYGKLAAQASVVLAESNFPGWKKLVLCNEASLPIFLGLGGKIVTYEDLAEVPVEAWEACSTCPNFATVKAQNKVCCDTPIIMP
jgi:N-acetylglutamate synthase-like GNAT family acetyltransferase